MSPSARPEQQSPILFFDGECVMCNGIVRWLFERDRDGTLRFASLQGETAARQRALHSDFPEGLQTFVFLEGDRLLLRSDAALAASRHLTWPWRWGWLGAVVPRFLRDALYRFIASHRIRWFGRTEHCWLPPPEARGRMLP